MYTNLLKNNFSLNTGTSFTGKTGYKSSKYNHGYSDTNILDSRTTSPVLPKNLDVNNNIAIYDYSKDKIKGLYRYFNLDTQYIDKSTDKILGIIAAGSVQSSYIEMLLDLVQDKKLSPDILCEIQGADGKINKNIAHDLDILYKSYISGIDPAKAFVREFDTETDALNSIETGDICKIGKNRNISIKMQNGTMKELFLTPKTYLELFPPVERYIFTQSALGDCYLLSTLDSINQNPKTRYKLLEMFRENPDGTVDVAYGGFKNKNGKTVQKEPKKTILKDIAPKIKKAQKISAASYTAEGIRAIEALHEKDRRKKVISDAKQQYDYFKTLKKHIKANDRIAIDKQNIFWFLLDEKDIEPIKKGLEETNSVMIVDEFQNWCVYTEKELDLYCSSFEKGKPMFNTGSRYDTFSLKKSEIEEKLSLLKHKTDDCSVYQSLVLKRLLRNLQNGDDRAEMFDIILPKKVIKGMFPDKPPSVFLHSNAGNPVEVLRIFGLNEIFDEPSDSKFIKEKLFEKDPSDYIFTCAAKEHGDNAGGSHAYSLTPVNIGLKRKFAVRNPHNTLCEDILSYEELCRRFTRVQGAKIA